MATADDRLPVHVVTGFLGAGKTTLLNRLLSDPQFRNCAVIVNEFGEIGLDHWMIESVDDDAIILINGCICCTVQSSLAESVTDILEKRDRSIFSELDRILVETTGLARPFPVLSTFLADPVLNKHIRLGHVVTVVDTVNVRNELVRNSETAEQIAAADCIVATKGDLISPQDLFQARDVVAHINSRAEWFDLRTEINAIKSYLTVELGDRARKMEQWLATPKETHAHESEDTHLSDVSNFELVFDQAADWSVFGVWLSMLLHAHGERILRVKGILNAKDSDTPVVIQAVQHLVHQPEHLSAWPTKNRQSHIIFIVRDLEPDVILKSFNAFCRQGEKLGEPF